MIQRETYDALTFAGDCGGFFSALYWFGRFTTTFYGSVNMWGMIVRELFKFEEKIEPEN